MNFQKKTMMMFLFDMIKIDTKKLHKDVVVKLNSLNISQRELSEKQGFSRSTLFRISHGKAIHFNHFLAFVSWLDVDPNNYLVKEYKAANGKMVKFALKKYLTIKD